MRPCGAQAQPDLVVTVSKGLRSLDRITLLGHNLANSALGAKTNLGSLCGAAAAPIAFTIPPSLQLGPIPIELKHPSVRKDKQRGAEPIIRPQLFEAREAVAFVLKLEFHIDCHGARRFAALNAVLPLIDSLRLRPQPARPS